MARMIRCLGLALVVTACSAPESTPSAEPASTVAPSAASPSAEPTATQEPSETVGATPTTAIAIGGVVEVVTTDLVMRSAPGGGGDSIVYPGALDAPTQLFVADGPVANSGYDWYLVYPFTFATSERPEHWRLAWVAAGSPNGEAWIAPATPNCPRPDLDGLIGLTGTAGLACFGDAPLTVEGAYGGCSYVTPGVITPSWLGSAFCWLRPLGTPTDALLDQPMFVFHVPAESSAISTLGYEPATPIQIVGHFDDPEAQACVAGPMPGPEPTPPPPSDEILAAQAVVLGCRSSFVMTTSEPLMP